MSDEKKMLTITLTGRSPVRVEQDPEGAWGIIASAKDHDGQVESQANRTWKLIVRQHDDGRTIVYGIYATSWQNEAGRRGGELLDAGADVPAAIYRVAEYLGFERRLADECIADLPAVEI